MIVSSPGFPLGFSPEFRLAMRRHRRAAMDYAGYDAISFALNQGAEAAGVTAAEEEIHGATTSKSIFVGVATGVSVWVLTKLIDRMFGLSGGVAR